MDFFGHNHNPFVVRFLNSMKSRIVFWIFVAILATMLCYYVEYVEFNSLWDVIATTIGIGANFLLATNLTVNLMNVYRTRKRSPFVNGGQQFGTMSVTFAVVFLCRMMTLGSSSFIEEEHFVWYYLTVTLYLLLILQHVFWWISERVQLKKQKTATKVASKVATEVASDQETRCAGAKTMNIDSRDDETKLKPKKRKLHYMQSWLKNFRQLRTLFCTLFVIIIAQNWNGAGVRWYDRFTIEKLLSSVNGIYLQLVFISGM